MTLSFHPVRSLRQVVHQIGHAVNASAEYSHAARQRQASLSRGERPAVQPLAF
ncbi:hypothetical protein PDO_2123 [Rhizobium sp. PDO1-076]|uniref:hypothetical protein n=1 Tax=Rhizobium sp. PDO1-076 TaxID=1125979 RepID=UPI00024E2B5E|nr:hypothetical protein [Rhizobium sp. PDO1-076]EHS51019.1 hypothetical protein PDO_2123 [Rhizobium sp. PDO1-076]